MVVNPVYDSSITSQADAATIEAAFGTASSVEASAFSDPVTVNVGVSWGSVDGMTLPALAIGSSVDNLYGYFILCPGAQLARQRGFDQYGRKRPCSPSGGLACGRE